MPSRDDVTFVPDEGLATPQAGHSVPDWLAPRIERVLIPERALRRRVSDLAAAIASAYPSDAELVLVLVLKGAFVFGADLARALWPAIVERAAPEPRIEFARAGRFGAEIKEAGRETRPASIDLLPRDVEGRDVLLVEDLIDEGLSLAALRDAVAGLGPRSLKICALLDKRLASPSPAARDARAGLHVDFVGFSVPDRWVAGYGIDAGEELRALPFIVAVRESSYARGAER